LDRLLKDIVAESASVYIPAYPETEKVRDEREENRGILVPYPDSLSGEVSGEDFLGAKKAFSLAHFIPLLRERIYVVSPFTRSYLVSWIAVLDSVPELELISYLPEFFDGLLSVHAMIKKICLTYTSFQKISIRSNRRRPYCC
jgi:vacuole morphology and inheritance protein 14